MSILRVVAGEHSLTEVSDLEQNGEVSSYVLHPKYDYNTLENDVAIVKVKSN